MTKPTWFAGWRWQQLRQQWRNRLVQRLQQLCRINRLMVPGLQSVSKQGQEFPPEYLQLIGRAPSRRQ